MELYAKPPVNNGRSIVRFMVGPLLILVGAFCLLSGIYDAQRYCRLEDSAIAVQAVITDVQMDNSDDSGVQYRVYVAYDYQDRHYDSFYKSFGERNWSEREGEVISVLINPEDPSEFMVSIADGALALLFGVVCYVGIGLLLMSHRARYGDTYGIRRTYVKLDLQNHIRQKLIIPAVIMMSGLSWVVKYAVYPNLFGLWLVVAGGILLIAGAVLLIVFLRQYSAVQEDAFRIHYDAMTDKNSRSDGDGGRCYELIYTGDRGKWKAIVTEKEYEEATSGEVAAAVYLTGRNHPMIYYRSIKR